jgi:hypothetical protein
LFYLGGWRLDFIIIVSTFLAASQSDTWKSRKVSSRWYTLHLKKCGNRPFGGDRFARLCRGYHWNWRYGRGRIENPPGLSVLKVEFRPQTRVTTSTSTFFFSLQNFFMDNGWSRRDFRFRICPNLDLFCIEFYRD